MVRRAERGLLWGSMVYLWFVFLLWVFKVAHKEQKQFILEIKNKFPDFFNNSKVLEVGSLDVNGSIRDFFMGCEYVGIDVAEGPGVNHVCQGQEYDAPDGYFDAVFSCEVMEHNPYWIETMQNMIRMCRPGGLVVMTCATLGRGEHGTTRTCAADSPLTVGIGWEYYKNLTFKDFLKSGALHGMDLVGHACDWISYDLYIFGFKKNGIVSEDFKQRVRLIEQLYVDKNKSSFKSIRRAVKANFLQKRC